MEISKNCPAITLFGAIGIKASCEKPCTRGFHRVLKDKEYIMAGFDVTKFASSKAKPLPIILLLDESNSMSGDKIERLNEAVRKMLNSFKKEETQASEFLVSVIGFGGDYGDGMDGKSAKVHNEPTAAAEIQFDGVAAYGWTPLGEALKLAKGIIEDKEKTPSRAYRPLVILVTDGLPTDDWKGPFFDFVENGRSAKCDRMALGVGGNTDMNMLSDFVAGTGHEVFTTEQADGIVKFFNFVTMSVVTRTRSQNPNLIPADREVKPLPVPGAIANESEELEAQVVEYEVVVEPEPEPEPAAAPKPINLDDEDDFWF